MSLHDLGEPLILFFVMLGTFVLARLMEKYMRRPGAKRSYTITDNDGNELRFNVLRSATDEERYRIFDEKRKELEAIQAKRSGTVNRSRKKR